MILNHDVYLMSENLLTSKCHPGLTLRNLRHKLGKCLVKTVKHKLNCVVLWICERTVCINILDELHIPYRSSTDLLKGLEA